MMTETRTVALFSTRLPLPFSTVVLLSHRLSSVVWTDRVIVLEAGKIVRDENIKATPRSDDSSWRNCLEIQGPFLRAAGSGSLACA